MCEGIRNRKRFGPTPWMRADLVKRNFAVFRSWTWHSHLYALSHVILWNQQKQRSMKAAAFGDGFICSSVLTSPLLNLPRIFFHFGAKDPQKGPLSWGRRRNWPSITRHLPTDGFYSSHLIPCPCNRENIVFENFSFLTLSDEPTNPSSNSDAPFNAKRIRIHRGDNCLPAF